MEQATLNGNGSAGVHAPPAPALSIHPSIVKATLKVQAAISAVAKDGKNAHGGYGFASTDAVYAQLTHKLAESGLMIMCLEEKEPEIVRVEKKDKDGREFTTQWGKFVFSFVLATEEATWTDPRSRRSLFIQITGPQTFMAAQSYAEKTYLRSLFKLPTGDMDLDSMPQADSEEEQMELGSGKGKRKTSAEGKRDGSVKAFNDIRAEIAKSDGPIDCQDVWKKHYKTLTTIPRSWFDTLAEEFTAKMSEFGVEVEIEQQGSLRMS